MKKYLSVVPLVLVFCFTIACQDKAAQAELEKFKTQAKVEDQNVAVVNRVFDELNKKNADVYQELYAPEYRWYFPSANPKGLSREEESGFVKLLWAGFPDCHWDVEEMVVHGDRVIVRFLFKGTHSGEFQGILPTGNKTEVGGIWMGRVKDGKIVECREEDDLLGWMQQMGMELRPIEAKKK
jgi:predicted ester cyclase